MERQLFDWEQYDELDTGAFMFYNVTLKQPIGDFPLGHEFPKAVLDFEEGLLQLNDGTNGYEYDLVLSVRGQH